METMQTANNQTAPRIIISGGGTGGHIFPAIAIANALKAAYPDAEILFVGAEGKMEMEKVPVAGYHIVGLPVVGLQRTFSLKNLLLPFKLMKSIRKASIIISDFRPDVVVGVGGYASGPVLWSAQQKHIPTLIQEQNSYAGLTNKILGKRAKCICTAYQGMERFFAKDKIVLTGNPIRQDLFHLDELRTEALKFFGLDPAKKTILLLGGSLGARTMNESAAASLQALQAADVQMIWQTGKFYFEQARQQQAATNNDQIKVHAFIYRMDYAFAAADMVVSRAGAGTVSELCVVGKPAILVPSPNVSEDHQTKNAMALVNQQAAIMVSDHEAKNTLFNQALSLLHDQSSQQHLRNNIRQLALPDAAKTIAKIIVGLVKKKQ